MQKDEITWRNIILNLVKSEQMDPWNIDISLLSKKYMEIVEKLQETNFFISGKVVLAASLLLKIKSNKLVSEDISNLDFLINPPEDEVYDEYNAEAFYSKEKVNIPGLAIKTPQKRKRKVSMNELISALHKALDVNQRKVLRKARERAHRHPEIPVKTFDITQLIRDVFDKIKDLFSKKEQVTFGELVKSDLKEDKITTFIPLLHLDHQNKIDISQKEHFGEIDIKLR